MRKNISALAGLACVTVTALLAVPAAADAASRNFKIENDSSETFVLEEVERVTCERDDNNCHGHTRGWYDMEFEGRPDEGDKLVPGKTHEFELKYFFTANTRHYNYAADLDYGDFQVRITTSNYSNNSSCRVYRADKSDLKCIADGRTIRIRDR